MVGSNGGRQWITSSLSAGEDCVAVRFEADGVQVRDSKHPDAGTLTFTESEWRAFVGGVRLGEFDNDLPEA
jgi:hypothetical protein